MRDEKTHAGGLLVGLRRAWAHSRTVKRRIVLLGLSSLVAGAVEAALLALVVQLALALSKGERDVALTAVPSLGDNVLSFSSALWIAAGLVIVHFALQNVVAYLPARVGAEVQTHLRSELVSAYLRSSWSAKSARPDGAIADLVITQSSSGAQAVTFLAQGVATTMFILAMLAGALALAPLAVLAIVVLVSVVFLALRPLTAIARRQNSLLAKLTGRLSERLAEAVATAESAEAFAVTDAEAKQLTSVVVEAAGIQARSSYFAGLVDAAYISAVLGLLVAGFALANAASVTSAGTLGAVAILLLRILTSSQGLQTVYHKVTTLSPYLDNVDDETADLGAASRAFGRATLSSVDTLELQHVSYSYGRAEPALVDVSFAIRPGEITGVVGPSGAGKSTLVQILLRLRQPLAGAYLVNGIPAHDYDEASWARLVRYVPQTPPLISGTIRENIRF